MLNIDLILLDSFSYIKNMLRDAVRYYNTVMQQNFMSGVLLRTRTIVYNNIRYIGKNRTYLLH